MQIIDAVATTGLNLPSMLGLASVRCKNAAMVC